jgi:hypothetical protein
VMHLHPSDNNKPKEQLRILSIGFHNPLYGFFNLFLEPDNRVLLDSVSQGHNGLWIA